jgi:hypothetical protein
MSARSLLPRALGLALGVAAALLAAHFTGLLQAARGGSAQPRPTPSVSAPAAPTATPAVVAVEPQR